MVKDYFEVGSRQSRSRRQSRSKSPDRNRSNGLSRTHYNGRSSHSHRSDSSCGSSRRPTHDSRRKDDSSWLRKESSLDRRGVGVGVEKMIEETRSFDRAVSVDPEDDVAIAQILGFSGFGSTKGTHVPGSNVSAVDVRKMPKYRQYMNRNQGFNKPLSN